MFSWLAGSFFACFGDRRERRGGYANLIAVIVFAIIIAVRTLFLMQESIIDALLLQVSLAR